MIKRIKIISLIIILVSLFIILYMELTQKYDIIVQNRIIDDVFNYDVLDNLSEFHYIESVSRNVDYLGYIYIPRFNIKRLIKDGTDTDILNSGFVGMHSLSGKLDGSDLVILAGHNVSNVFHKLHSISIGDVVYIHTFNIERKFVVYDFKVIDEDDSSYFGNRNNELLLITCTKHSGERLVVFLKEEL